SLEAQIQSEPEATMRVALQAAEKAHAELERLGDEYGAIWALRLIGNFQGWLGNSRESERTWRRALERAEPVHPRLRGERPTWRPSSASRPRPRSSSAARTRRWRWPTRRSALPRRTISSRARGCASCARLSTRAGETPEKRMSCCARPRS